MVGFRNNIMWFLFSNHGFWVKWRTCDFASVVNKQPALNLHNKSQKYNPRIRRLAGRTFRLFQELTRICPTWAYDHKICMLLDQALWWFTLISIRICRRMNLKDSVPKCWAKELSNSIHLLSLHQPYWLKSKMAHGHFS